MSRHAAVLLLLVLPATACADAGSSFPGIRSVWINYTFTVEQEYPDYDFYVLTTMHKTAVQVPLSPSTPVRLSGEEYPAAWGLLFAVKKPLRPPDRNPWDIEAWLHGSKGRGVVVLGPSEYEYLRFGSSLPFTDNRKSVEIVYRVELGPDGSRLVKVSENVGDPWVRWAWIAVGVLMAVGFVGLGFWSLRRMLRRTPRPSAS
jgi:hypothetical protein